MKTNLKRTITIAILLTGCAFAKQPKLAAYPSTGHVEWSPSTFRPDFSVTAVMPSGSLHTMDCDGNVCAFDRAHGAVIIVLEDGARVTSILGTESMMVGPFNHGPDGLYGAAMTASADKTPWPTFKYRLGKSSKCAYVTCGADDVSLYLQRLSPDPIGVHPELEYHVTLTPPVTE